MSAGSVPNSGRAFYRRPLTKSPDPRPEGDKPAEMDLVDDLAKPVLKKYIDDLPYSVDTFVCPSKAEKS